MKHLPILRHYVKFVFSIGRENILVKVLVLDSGLVHCAQIHGSVQIPLGLFTNCLSHCAPAN